MEKIAVITSGFLPVPATKGGAVENLIMNIINENEKKGKFQLEILSIYDKNALIETNNYNKTSFKFIKINFLIKLLDKITFFISKNILKKKNSHSYRYIFQRIAYLRSCSKILKNNNYDKVLLQNHPSQYLALKWKNNYVKYNGRYFYHCHNEFNGTYGCDKIIRNTKKFICVSQYIANQLSSYLQLEKEKFVVLRNCIDYDKFSQKLSSDEALSIKKKYGINSNDKVLLFTGRIVQEKGVLELLKSLKNIKFQDYKLLIIGSPLNELKVKTDYQLEIEKIVSSLNDKVIFTGYVNYNDIYKFYSIADVAVLPSIWNDPAPLTVIESLVSGLPIVTTNSGGVPEYAINGSAIILERDELLIQNLSSSISDLLNNKEKLKNMSKISKMVSNDLRLENYYNNFYKIMK